MPIKIYSGAAAGGIVLAFVSRLDEKIADEQVQRVLAPVLAMIRAGVFDRPEQLRQ